MRFELRLLKVLQGLFQFSKEKRRRVLNGKYWCGTLVGDDTVRFQYDGD